MVTGCHHRSSSSLESGELSDGGLSNSLATSSGDNADVLVFGLDFKSEGGLVMRSLIQSPANSDDTARSGI